MRADSTPGRHGTAVVSARGRGAQCAILGLAVLLVMACARTQASSPELRVARIGERALTASTLARWLVLGQPLRLDGEVAEELARHWLELTALNQVPGLRDSVPAELVRAALADAIQDSTIAAGRARRFPDLHARITAEAARVTTSRSTHMIAHVLRRADASTRAAERELQRLAAERIRARLVSGGTWAEAQAENEDDSTRDRDGVIGLIAPGELSEPLASAVAALEPGGYSEVVESTIGFHILYRPRIEGEWRARLLALVGDDVVARADSAIGAELLRAAQVDPVPGAAATVRAMAREPWRSVMRADTLVRSGTRAWTAGEVAADLAGVPVGARRALIAAGDAAVETLLYDIVARDLMTEAAKREGATPEDAAIVAMERAMRDRIRAAAGRVEQSAGASDAMTPAARAELLPHAVERHLEAVVARRAPLEPLPSRLVLQLLEGADWMLDADALSAALETARRLIRTASPELAEAAGIS